MKQTKLIRIPSHVPASVISEAVKKHLKEDTSKAKKILDTLINQDAAVFEAVILPLILDGHDGNFLSQPDAVIKAVLPDLSKIVTSGLYSIVTSDAFVKFAKGDLHEWISGSDDDDVEAKCIATIEKLFKV
jgi:hypothetical protein